MCSYNVCCFVSKVTIDCGDRVYLIPVKKTNNNFFHLNSSLSHTSELLEPVMLPILGIYDDYGSIKVEHNDAAKFLERQFKKPIDFIIDPDNNFFDCALYVHESVYDSIGQQLYRDYDGKKKEDYDFDQEFYKMNVAINREIKYAVDSLKFNRQHREQLTDERLEDLNSYQLNQLKTLSFHYAGGGLFFDIWLRKFPVIGNLYKKIFVTNKLKESMIKFAKFDYNLYCCNTAYTQPANGQQYGNHFMVREMLKAATKINNAKIARQKENLRD